MNADRLLALFEPISEAPDAIPRLRRFILDLAVRGKLVEQDPEDEPAEELLREMESRFKRLRITKKQVLLEAKEIPFALPDRWQWTRLGQICEKTGSGSTPRGCKEAYSETGIPFLRSQNVYNDGLRLADVVFIDHQIHQRMAGTTVLPCDLLLNITGGSIGRCAKVPVDFKEANVSQHVAIIRVGMPGMEDFIHAFILSPYFQSFVDKSQTGAGRGGLPKNRMDAIPVALPPLAEQHRIVAKLDELMALCDQLEAARMQREECRDRLVAASLQRLNQPSVDPEAFPSDARFALQVLPSLTTTPAQIKQLRQTILNLAVRGKLVEQDPEDEPAELLLQCLQQHSRKSGSSAFKGESLPFDLPVGWAPATLGDMVQASNSGWSPKTLDVPRQDEEWGILKVSAVSWERFQPNANKQVLPGTQPKPQAIVEKGDFLISRANTAELVARAVIVDCDPVNLMMSDKIVRLQLVELCEPRYILIVNNHATFARSHFANHATGVSPSMKNVSRDVILGLPLPLPPLAEQHRIVAKVDELMALCDQLEQQLSQAEQSRRGLLEAVLREALAGRLPERPEQSHAAF
jgi:type I restriction enzyme S subunit